MKVEITVMKTVYDQVVEVYLQVLSLVIKGNKLHNIQMLIVIQQNRHSKKGRVANRKVLILSKK